MSDQQNKIEQLKQYFESKDSVILAYVFGSKSKGTQRSFSDWDIAVYLRTNRYYELESNREYPEEHSIWKDLENILKSNEVDLLVLNRAKPPLVFSILNSGIPLVVKDRKLYMILLIKTHYEAVDWWKFTKEFYEIAGRAESISEEDKSVLRTHIRFLENEFADIIKFERLSRQEYMENNDKRRNVERWVENLVMSAIDISKIMLASKKKEIPQTYRETLLRFAIGFLDEDSARRFSQFTELRNILAHEYLDMKWEKITKFIKDASLLFPAFIEKTKGFLNLKENI
ncbi:MAG: type VII toxin-antitoxin system MntA family adenylyltransferase antitoxin [Candidatus Aminicenantes bacterium]